MAFPTTEPSDKRAPVPIRRPAVPLRGRREVVVHLRVRTLLVVGVLLAALLGGAVLLLALRPSGGQPPATTSHPLGPPPAPEPGRLPTGGRPVGPPPGPAPVELWTGTGAPFPIVGVALPMFAGQEVTGSRVPVQAVLSENGFWVGSSETDRLFVRSDEPSVNPIAVKAGDTVTVRGLLLGVPDDAETRFGLTGPALEQLRATAVYLHVTSISAP